MQRRIVFGPRHHAAVLGRFSGCSSGCLLACLCALWGCAASGPTPDAKTSPVLPRWAELSNRPTELQARTKASGAEAPPTTLPEGFSAQRYVSAGQSLFAALGIPLMTPRTAQAPVERLPAVVLLHDKTSIDDDTLARGLRLVDAGFIVLIPTWRGEHGNPGAFELLRGEVDDARAATRFLAEQPLVDVDRLYAFGHGVGGALAGLLALGDAPFALLASSGGLWEHTDLFHIGRSEGRSERFNFVSSTPFDAGDLRETSVRCFAEHADELSRALIVYARRRDIDDKRIATRMLRADAARHLLVEWLDSDSASADDDAFADFTRRITSHAFGGGAVSVARSAFRFAP